jgi:ATP-dependent RNA helicase RhlE
MHSFKDLNIAKPLLNALEDLGFTEPTPIQESAFPVVLSGKNVVGVSQTGTGKTLAYMLPILQDLKFTKEKNPTVLIIVPTRELVIQVVDQINAYSKYKTVSAIGVYGGTNINTQGLAVKQGMDILVGTPGRLYDLVLARAVVLKNIKKLVIDEVDVMLDLGFIFQLNNIFELLPEKRQNIMFSATMTEEVDALIKAFFYSPVQLSIAISGKRLENIEQVSYAAPNFHTKANLLAHLLKTDSDMMKVLVFAPSKRIADRLFERFEEDFGRDMTIIHSNKSQNARIAAVESFDDGTHRILIATDVIARGLDFDHITHVINFDTPIFPENYMHRIGRSGRAEQKGTSILFFSEKEVEAKIAIELLMNYEIPAQEIPAGVKISRELIPEEQTKAVEILAAHRRPNDDTSGPAFHEKSAKNSKVNLGSRYHREIKTKFKKPLTRGDKNQNKKRK